MATDQGRAETGHRFAGAATEKDRRLTTLGRNASSRPPMFCASEPKRLAQRLVEQGYSKRYDYALEALSEIPYDVWREYDPEDTLRLFGLRLYEAGLIQASPNKLIAEHTGWYFLDELKRELKT
jgi:NitT/TauT family transport system substrate-binding protein